MTATDSEQASGLPTIVCTLSKDDKGDACQFCGYVTGPGHGKKREGKS